MAATPARTKTEFSRKSILGEVFPPPLSQLGPVLTVSEVPLFSFCLFQNFIYRHTLEKLQVQFHTTTVKQIITIKQVT